MDKFSDPKGKAIRKQALFGLLFALAGLGLMLLIGSGHDARALDKDPTPLMPGIVLSSIGGLFVIVARIRLLFHRPKTLVEDGVQEGLKRLLSDLVG